MLFLLIKDSDPPFLFQNWTPYDKQLKGKFWQKSQCRCYFIGMTRDNFASHFHYSLSLALGLAWFSDGPGLLIMHWHKRPWTIWESGYPGSFSFFFSMMYLTQIIRLSINNMAKPLPPIIILLCACTDANNLWKMFKKCEALTGSYLRFSFLLSFIWKSRLSKVIHICKTHYVCKTMSDQLLRWN